MSVFGGGFGGFSAGGRASVGAAGRKGNGLPFAGIPAELAAGVAALESREPDHGDPGVSYDPVGDAGGRVSLGRLLIGRPGYLLAAVLAVVVETVLLQAGPYLVQIGIDHGIAVGDLRVLILATAAFAVAVVCTGLATAIRMRQIGRLAASATRDLRIRIFAHLQRQSLDYYTAEKAGVTMTRMTSDVESLQNLLQDGFAQLLIQALTMVVVTGVLVHYNPELALITLALVVPPLAAASLWFRRAADRGYNRERDTIAAMFADLSESLNGVRVVTAHNRQERNVVAHREVVGDYRDANDWTGRINAVYGPGTSVIGLIAMAVMLLIGGRMVLRGTLTIGELTAFVLYINAFFQPVQQLVQLYTQYQQARAAVGKIRGLLGTPPSVAERRSATALPPVRGEIVLDDVSFAYLPGRPVLAHVSLTVRAGETVACVGPTGAGKSTIAKLARAFLAEPRVVVLDEATSSLDLRSELRVETALDRLLEGRTAILVAHRLSTAMRADRIIVVDDHGIIESGTHASLVAAGGRYATMYATWAAPVVPPAADR